MSAAESGFILVLLEGRTDRVGRRGGMRGADCDLVGCAIAVAVVIHAIHNVTLDVLDVLFASASVFVIHFHISFCQSDNSSFSKILRFIHIERRPPWQFIPLQICTCP